jgi:hypothetical protein
MHVLSARAGKTTAMKNGLNEAKLLRAYLIRSLRFVLKKGLGKSKDIFLTRFHLFLVSVYRENDRSTWILYN